VDQTIQAVWIARRIKIEPLDPWTHMRSARKLPGVSGGRRLRPIRIVLGCRSGLLRDIVVEAIKSEPELQVIVEVDEQTRAQDQLEHSSRGTLLLSDDGRSAELHWLEPRTACCSDVSPEGLVALIRHAFAGEVGR
jgi:hypothetical protein